MKEYRVLPSHGIFEDFKPFKDISEMTADEKHDYCNSQICCAKCDACVWDRRCPDVMVFIKKEEVSNE